MSYRPSPHLKPAAVPLEAEAPLLLYKGVFMKDRFLEYKTTIGAFAITVPFAATVWLFTVPHMLSTVTFVGFVLLAMGAALVAVNTWRNGQATGTIGHVLNHADATAALPPTAAADAGHRV